MTDLTSRLLSRLMDHKLPGLEFEGDFIVPKYEDQSILNIPPTICQLMNLPGFGSGSLVTDIVDDLGNDIDNVILILMDALAYQRFVGWSERESVWNILMENGVLAPLTSVVPSTTSSALTSFWTGVSPATHGIIGYEMWLKEFSMVANMITHAPMTFKGSVDSLEFAGFSPDRFLTLPTFGSHFLANGVKPYSFTHYSIANSGLSRMLMKGVEVVPFQTPASMWISIRNLMENHIGERKFVWTYWGQVDGISHYHGPDDDRTKAEFSHFSSAFQRFFLDQLSVGAREKTLIILTADHGQTYTPIDPDQVIENHPILDGYLIMKPTCENRFTFLYTRNDMEKAVQDYFSDIWPGRFDLITKEMAFISGLFGSGPHHPDINNRVGDLIAIARDDAYLWWSDEQDFLVGRHGGLNSMDMLVPFLAARI